MLNGKKNWPARLCIIGGLAFMFVFAPMVMSTNLSDNYLAFFIIGGISLIVVGIFLLKTREPLTITTPCYKKLTKREVADAKIKFKDIEKKEKVFKNVRYHGGFPNVEAGDLINLHSINTFSKPEGNPFLHICAMPEGITFFNYKFYNIQAVIPWNRLIKMETSSGMSDFDHALITGAAVNSMRSGAGVGGAIATGVIGGILQNNLLVFYVKQNDNDDFIQEIKFDTPFNEKIKMHIVAKRASLFPNGIKKSINTEQEINSEDALTQIGKLAALKDQGTLTEEEFMEKKKVLLGKIK